MPSDLAIAGAWRIAQPAGTGTTRQAPEPAAIPLRPNPSARMDARDWIVILEFHDRDGNVTYAIPSPRKLAALRSAAPAG